MIKSICIKSSNRRDVILPHTNETQACTIFTQTVNHSLLTIVGKWKVWMRENKIPKLIESARKLHILLTLSVNSPAVGTIFGGEWGQSSKPGSLVGTIIGGEWGQSSKLGTLVGTMILS
jgi:hypothetical protein